MQQIVAAYFLTHDFWFSCVNRNRQQNRFCENHRWSYRDIKKIYDNDMSQDRGTSYWRSFVRTVNDLHHKYAWSNWLAYNKFQTVEIRLHQGTLYPLQIINWIKGNLKFVDWSANSSLSEIEELFLNKYSYQFGQSLNKQFEIISNIWNDNKLSDYYLKKINKRKEQRNKYVYS